MVLSFHTSVWYWGQRVVSGFDYWVTGWKKRNWALFPCQIHIDCMKSSLVNHGSDSKMCARQNMFEIGNINLGRKAFWCGMHYRELLWTRCRETISTDGEEKNMLKETPGCVVVGFLLIGHIWYFVFEHLHMYICIIWRKQKPTWGCQYLHKACLQIELCWPI